MDILIIVIAAVVGLALGFGIAKMLEKKQASQTLLNAKRGSQYREGSES